MLTYDIDEHVGSCTRSDGVVTNDSSLIDDMVAVAEDENVNVIVILIVRLNLASICCDWVP